jgi:large subunit ribosomal protein L29
MKMSELRGLSDGDLQQRLVDLREESFNLRFQYATRQLTNHARMCDVRRDVARILTLLRERDLTLAWTEAASLAGDTTVAEPASQTQLTAGAGQ